MGRGKPAPRPDDDPSDEAGLINDEYTDDALDVPELDALDVPAALVGEDVLADVADTGGDGIEEIDILPVSGLGMDTIDTGDRRPVVDEADMGLGAEPRSPEEMEEAAIGHALRGKAAVTRDDELHGELLLDAPDDTGDAGEGGDDDRTARSGA
jgi:hypothetical protein